MRLKRNNLTSEYNDIIREQLENSIIEPAPTTAQGTEFYIPHKAVVREITATTKVRIVYDASTKVNPDAPSSNNCLYAGPPLQNRLWEVLIQQRAYPDVASRDIAKAFLQVRIREGVRDALRFHLRDNNEQLVKVYRFTGSLFVSSQMWSHGLTWLSNPTEWPTNPVMTSTNESEKEAKTIRQMMLSTPQIPSDDFHLLLAKYPLRKVLCIQTYLRRFRTRNRGPITTEESQRELTWWI